MAKRVDPFSKFSEIDMLVTLDEGNLLRIEFDNLINSIGSVYCLTLQEILRWR